MNYQNRGLCYLPKTGQQQQQQQQQSRIFFDVIFDVYTHVD